MKEINSFTIDSSSLTSVGGVKQYTVSGDPGAVFSLVIINNAGNFYNFPEKTIVSKDSDTVRPAGAFSTTATKLFNQKLNDQGFYNSTIEFPVSGSDDKYTILLQAEAGFKTSLNSSLSANDVYYAADVYQYADARLTFAVASTGSPSTYVNHPNPPDSSYTVAGSSTNSNNLNFNKKLTVSWSVALSSSQFIIARQPTLNDFFFSTTRVFNNTGDSALDIQLTDVSGLSVGMAVSGTSISSNSVIKEIIPGFKDENKSTANNHVYVIPKSIDAFGKTIENSKAGTILISNNSSWNAGDNLTIKGFGSSHADIFNNTKFSVSNLALTIDPVVTTTDAAMGSNSVTIPLTSTDGIKAVDTVIMSGIGVKGTPHVDSVSAGASVNVSVEQTALAIDNGQTLTFTGSSRNATITADIIVEKYGKDNLTMTLELDNILTVG